MENIPLTRKQCIQTLILTFVLSWPLQALACYVSFQGNPIPFVVILAVVMFMPLLAQLIARKTLRGLGWKPEFSGKWRWWLMAWFSPTILCLLGGALFYLIFSELFDSQMGYMSNLAKQLGQDLTKKHFDAFHFWVILGGCLTTFPVINGIPALGEEVTWRGCVYPFLKEKFGNLRGLILGGIIWGVWHWPVIIFGGFNYGTDYFGSPWAGPPVFCLTTICLGIFLDYLRTKTRCIIAPAIAHGVINAAGTLPLVFLSASGGKYMIFGPAPIGLIGFIPSLLCAGVMARAMEKEKEKEAGEKTEKGEQKISAG